MPRKSKQETNHYYVDYILKCKREADDAARPVRDAWKELWQVYQNKQDNTKKASWQSQCFAPKIFMQVEKASGEVKRAVIQTRKLFKFELDDLEERLRLEFLKEQTENTQEPNAIGFYNQLMDKIKRDIKSRQSRMALTEQKFKKSLGQTNLTNIYSIMTKVAFLLGLGIPKVLWDAKNQKVTYENVDAFNISISPDYMPFQMERPPYIIEYKRIKYAKLIKMAKDVNREAGKKVFDAEEIKKIEADFTNPEYETQERQRRGQGYRGTVSKDVEILEFWGDVISEDDKEIEENLLLVVANKKYLIRNQPNPFDHGKPPYPLAMPLPYPHRGATGTSLVQPQVKLNYVFNNILNMYVDNLNYAVNKVFEYNPADLVNPKALTAFYPGKKIEVNTEGQKEAVREIMKEKVGDDPLKALELIDRVMQEGSNVTEFVSGWPAKKAKTLGEVEIKTAQSRGLFDVIARDLEENSLRELLEMSYDLYVQFAGYEERKDNYIFSVGGLSLLLMQRELVERIGQVIALALKAPEILGVRTDIDDLWKKLLSIYNLADAYKEVDQTKVDYTPEQLDAVRAQAEQDAQRDVAGMTPQRQMQLVG